MTTRQGPENRQATESELPPAGTAPTAGSPASPVTDLTPRRRVHRTRIGAIWVGVIAAAIVLILLLIFILQNSRKVEISYLGMHGQLSLAVAMLLSAVAGIMLVALPGTARIVQLRRGVRHGQPKHR